MSRRSAGPVLAAADFERVLGTPPRARSEHFVLHHGSPVKQLSTDAAATAPTGVEERRRFGLVIPKRHARRAVTRSLIKRQGRAAWLRHAALLGAGDWLLRLRSPFDPARYASAASPALRGHVREELERLFGRAGRPPG